MSKGAKLADIIASVHITLDALAQAQSSNARPGMHNTRETRGRLQRKEVRKAYCNLLDVEQELFTLKRQIENEEDVVLPRNVRDGDAHFRIATETTDVVAPWWGRPPNFFTLFFPRLLAFPRTL